jgi:putative chitinase
MEPWLPHLKLAMEAAEVNTDTRIAHFLSQIGHESGGLKWTTEIWGPTPQQLRYERNFSQYWGKYVPRFHTKTYPNKLAFDLGNFAVGDGAKFKGHGLIQVTGRVNHKLAEARLGALLGTEVVPIGSLMNKPQLLGNYHLAAMSAADYWIRCKLNTFADENDIRLLTRRINGGYNGLSHRQFLYNRFFLLHKA